VNTVWEYEHETYATTSMSNIYISMEGSKLMNKLSECNANRHEASATRNVLRGKAAK